MKLFCFGCMRWRRSVKEVTVTVKWKGTKIKETSWLCVTCRNKVKEIFHEVNKK